MPLPALPVLLPVHSYPELPEPAPPAMSVLSLKRERGPGEGGRALPLPSWGECWTAPQQGPGWAAHVARQGDRGPGRRPVAVRWNGAAVEAGSGPNISFQGALRQAQPRRGPSVL